MAYLTIPPSTSYANVSIVGAGGVGATGSTYTVPWNGAGTSGVWTTASTTSPGLTVSGDTSISGNLTVQGTNVTEILKTIQDRLAILVPDPKLLAKYEALRQAYEHYKTLEALCVDEDKPD